MEKYAKFGSKEHIDYLNKKRIDLLVRALEKGIHYHVQEAFINTANYYLRQGMPNWYAISLGIKRGNQVLGTYKKNQKDIYI